MKKFLVVIVCCLGLVACEMMRPYPKKPADRWFKEGVTEAQVTSKQAKCTYDVGMNKVEHTEKLTLIQNCMLADGFLWGIPESEEKAWQQKVDDLRKQGYQLY